MKLLLVDLDGTLLLSGGAGKRALEDVFAARYGKPDAFRGVDPGGKTDPRILREMARNSGVAMERIDRDMPLLCAEYLDRLRVHMPAAPATLMPGVQSFLEAASAADGVLLGLLTGNLEEGARIKLARFDLNGYFSFGAFGSDSEDRNALVPVAVARASALLGRPVAGGRNVVVLGDTALDIECGKAHGAVTIGVATGGTSVEELERHGPDRVFDDLSDAAAVVECVLRGG